MTTKMNLKKLILFSSVLFSGAFAYASLEVDSSAADQDNQMIADQLNASYPGLNLSFSADSSPEAVISELYTLSDVLQGSASVPVKNLLHLTCGAPECGGCGQSVCSR